MTGPPPGTVGLPPLPDGSRNMNPEGIGFWALLCEDFRTNDASFGHQGFWMLAIHRFGNWRMDVRPRVLRAPLSLLYKVLNKFAQIAFGMKLDYTVKVGRRVKLAGGAIVTWGNCLRRNGLHWPGLLVHYGYYGPWWATSEVCVRRGGADGA